MGARHDFENLVLPHLDAAYNLARWLLRDETAAEDAVQEASVRAYRYIASIRGTDAKPWLLGIVRNTCFTALESRRKEPVTVEFDEELFALETSEIHAHRDEPSSILAQRDQRKQIDAALRALSPTLREVIVLREFEELDYSQIAKIVDTRIGTVMSRLSRAREKLRIALLDSGVGYRHER